MHEMVYVAPGVYRRAQYIIHVVQDIFSGWWDRSHPERREDRDRTSPNASHPQEREATTDTEPKAKETCRRTCNGIAFHTQRNLTQPHYKQQHPETFLFCFISYIPGKKSRISQDYFVRRVIPIKYCVPRQVRCNTYIPGITYSVSRCLWGALLMYAKEMAVLRGERSTPINRTTIF